MYKVKLYERITICRIRTIYRGGEDEIVEKSRFITTEKPVNTEERKLNL